MLCLKHLEFKKFWFDNKQKWFVTDSIFDKYLTENFIELLNIDKLNKIIKILLIENLIQEKYLEEYLAIILICDQLSRNCFRENKDNILNFDKISLKLSKLIINHNIFGNYNPEEKCFIMLPFRHSNDIVNNEIILRIVSNLRLSNDVSIYKRFYRATLLRLSKLKSIQFMKNIAVSNIEHISMNDIVNILDEKSVNSLQLVDINQDNKLVKIVVNYIKKYQITNITISLSGGVDSMVLATILSSLKNKYKLNIKGFNINYGNRELSSLETELCIRWCNMLKIPIYVRNINEIKRSRDKDRDIYEEITKIIRFHCYELLGNTVFLGHNKDDKMENILANIIKQQNFDNLYGMVEHYQDIVPIGRPLLDISKNEIYEFAKEFSIPYVYDSTPKWCERGKKRDILIPFLNEFDPRLLIGLDKLSQYVGDLTKISNDFINSCITYNVDNLNKLNINIKIATINFKIFNYDKQFWNLCLIEICKMYKLPYITKKSCNNSYQLIKLRACCKIILSKILYINDKFEVFYN